MKKNSPCYRFKIKKIITAILMIGLILSLTACLTAAKTETSSNSPPPIGQDLPVTIPTLTEMPSYWLFPPNAITYDQLNNIRENGQGDLIIDLNDTSLTGTVYVGPYPFGGGISGYDIVRFAATESISEGKAVLPLKDLYEDSHNANNWGMPHIMVMPPQPTPTAAYRLELVDDKPKYLGIYDSLVSFQKNAEGKFIKMPSFLEGPFVSFVSGKDSAAVEIFWRSDEPCEGVVFLGDEKYDSQTVSGTEHQVRIEGLDANTRYSYRVHLTCRDGRFTISPTHEIRTAPKPGQGPVNFVFAGDSRADTGTGESSYMSTNLAVMKQISAAAFRDRADFLILGGDLVNGMTPDTDDFTMQLRGWKQSVAGYWRTRPVFTGMGNHEYGWRLFAEPKTKKFKILDRWPYATESGEAVFAAESFNPLDAPEPADPRRPTYRESVYSFQYGPVLMISVNNTYWYALDSSKNGGSPLGYIMDDQMAWVKKRLAQAENDPDVSMIFLYLHAPVYPCMNHAKDAMWWNGDNNVRAYVKNSADGKLEPTSKGIIEVRNELWEAVSNSSKVAAVLSSDEHIYHRTLISDKTPVGVYPGDDTDGDGKLDRYSPNARFKYPTWHITTGNAGAPYNTARAKTPWAPDVVTPHFGYIHVQVDGSGASMSFVALPTNEVIDRIDDLMAVKKDK